MGKVIKVSICFIFICLFALMLPGCGRKDEVASNSNKKATIGSVNYESLTEAVKNAQTGDTIKVYNDVKDNKNVIIDKPLTIKGVSNTSQIKPKFYGSLTINSKGEQDLVEISNIELIHKGTNADGENNNTTIGINLIDGGLDLKSSIITLDSMEKVDKNASGVVISRDINSINTMPINIKGNNFEAYQSKEDGLSSALIIKSNKDGEFKKLLLNEEEIYNQNAFSSKEAGNQLISIDYSSEPVIFEYFATTSLKEFVDALNENQGEDGGLFSLYTVDEVNVEMSDNPINIFEKTVVYIDGNSPLNFQGSIFKLSGVMELDGEVSDMNIEKTSDTANVIINKDAKTSNIEIK